MNNSKLPILKIHIKMTHNKKIIQITYKFPILKILIKIYHKKHIHQNDS